MNYCPTARGMILMWDTCTLMDFNFFEGYILYMGNMKGGQARGIVGF